MKVLMSWMQKGWLMRFITATSLRTWLSCPDSGPSRHCSPRNRM